MSDVLNNFKVETPTKQLDSIFSLDSFKYNDMKGLFKDIYAYLTKFGLKMTEFDKMFANIPDFDKLMKELKDHEKRLNELDRRSLTTREEFQTYKVDNDEKLGSHITGCTESFGSLEQRMKQAEDDIDELRNRPIATGGGGGEIDYSLLCSKEQYMSLLRRIEQQEKRNLEQDDRLTNNELRIGKLEKMISDPLERILALEMRCDGIHIELNNKVNIQDLYNELLKKADLNGLKALEASLIRLNELINDLSNQFADRVENDKAHKLLQKNLKNLYDLFMSLKGDGAEDDPMFTAKGLFCASCTKGVQNMIGFRSDHSPWNNFPFKEPGVRMSKQGQGFSKMYTKSQYEGSYYGGQNPALAQAHTSAQDLNDHGNWEQIFSAGKDSKLQNAKRGMSAGGRRTRPMTAKVSNKGIK